MADEADAWKDPLSQIDVFGRINQRIYHILIKIGCKPEGDIIEELAEVIDESVLEKCRNTLFEVATQIFENGLGGKPNLELKLRRGETKAKHYAQDILVITLYLCGLKSEFPKDVLAKQGICIDTSAKEKNCDSGTAHFNRNTNPNNQESCDCRSVITVMGHKYQACQENIRS